MSTDWTWRGNLQTDYWAWLDEDLSVMTDENDIEIFFHTWDYYDADTDWITRTTI